MEIVLAIASVVYAALCIWLTVRIVNRRKRWARLTLAAQLVGMPVLYVAGLGPAIWLTKLDDPW
jgi:cytochrome c oxidase assembly factor CtaG